MNPSTSVLTTLALFPHYISAAGGANGRNQAAESAYVTYLIGSIVVNVTNALPHYMEAS